MTATASSLSPATDLAALKATADFSSETAEILNARLPFSARATLFTIASMIAAGIALATLLPVERVVSARGRVAAVAPRIMVQPLETSIIRSINVRTGQTVSKGDILATLDPTFSTADVSALRREMASLDAEIARLKAEIDGAGYVPTSSDMFPVLQKRIFDSRADQYRSTIDTYESKMLAQQSVIDQSQHEIAFYNQRLGIIGEVQDMKSQLVDKKIVSRTEYLSITDTRIEVQRALAQAQGALENARHELQSLQSQRDNFKQKWQSDSMTQLVDRQERLDSVREQLAKADKRYDMVSLRAPEDAVVLQIGDVSVGSVVESAQNIFALVPSSSPLEVDAEISTADQGFIKIGQEVDLKFDAWPAAQHGSGHGTVRAISADSFSTDQKAGASARSVYRAQIDIEMADLKKVPSDFRLVPGMTLTSDIVVGDHTLAEYLLDRAIPNLTEGFREP